MRIVAIIACETSLFCVRRLLGRSTMSGDIEYKIQLLEAHQKRLKLLELRNAQLGIAADPSISIEIDDIREKISNIESEIAETKMQLKKGKRKSTETRYVITSDISVETDALIDKLAFFVQQCQENNVSACLIYFDIDRLYGINRSFGFQVGDKITNVVESIVKELHSNDLAVRWEGDEFIIGLKSMELSKAKQCAESLRRRIKNYDWTGVAPHLYVSASFGVSLFNEQESATEWLIRTIYGCREAKIKENRICLAPETLSRTASRNPSDYLS
jgi:diguanylate cyclase (GGDEF)-like protein